MATDIVQFVDELDALLNDNTDGINAELANVDSQARKLESIGNTFQHTREGAWKGSPALLAMHMGVQPDPGGQGKRDWTHEVAFFYRNRDPDPGLRRKNAAWTVHALLRTVQPKDGCPTSITGIQRVDVQGASAELWQRGEDQEDELILARIDFVTREQL